MIGTRTVDLLGTQFAGLLGTRFVNLSIVMETIDIFLCWVQELLIF